MQSLIMNYITCLGTYWAEVTNKKLIFKKRYTT